MVLTGCRGLKYSIMPKAFTRKLEQRDIAPLSESFIGTPWERRGTDHFKNFLQSQLDSERIVLVGLIDSTPVGHVSILWKSKYTPFQVSNIPEINDLTVAPSSRRLGVATSLLDHTENIVGEKYSSVGIGFGLHEGYGNAQYLYVKKGYLPDRKGVVLNDRVVNEGESIRLGDEPAIYLTKRLSQTKNLL